VMSLSLRATASARENCKWSAADFDFSGSNNNAAAAPYLSLL